VWKQSFAKKGMGLGDHCDAAGNISELSALCFTLAFGRNVSSTLAGRLCCEFILSPDTLTLHKAFVRPEVVKEVTKLLSLGMLHNVVPQMCQRFRQTCCPYQQTM